MPTLYGRRDCRSWFGLRNSAQSFGRAETMFVPLITLAVVLASLLAIALPYFVTAVLQVGRSEKPEPGELPPGWEMSEQRS